MTQRHPIQSEALFFVTTVVRDRRPIFANPSYAREAIETLYRVQERYPFFIHGFVMMPDHCHLLIYVTEHARLDIVMKQYKSGTAFNIGLGPIWQPRYFIRLPDNAQPVLHYIHQNPVRAGLVVKSEDYPWSSASGRWDVVDMDCL